MNRSFFIFCSILFALSVYAQTDMDREKKKVLSTAYKYRKDINAKVLEKTKKWQDGVGVLHSDWIENLQGRSIDMQGNDLFPQFDYTGLELYCDSFFVMTINERKGVVSRSGKQLTEFAYWGFDFSRLDQGLIIAKRNAIGTGGVDIYSQLGHLVYTLDEFSNLAVGYDASSNQIIIQYDDATKSRQNIFRYPDGSPIGDNDGQHPSMTVMTYDDASVFDSKVFEQNIWIQKFREFYNAGKYKEAHFCLEYYNDYEKQMLKSQNTTPNFLHFAFDLKCRQKLKDYGNVISIVKGDDPNHLAPNGLCFYPGERQMKFNVVDAYPNIDIDEVSELVNDINSIYSSSVTLYKEQEVRRQQRSQTWGLIGAAALGAAANVATSFTQGYSSSSSGANRQTGTSAVSMSNSVSNTSSSGSSSSSNSSKSGELVTVEKHVSCKVCNGSGKIKKTRGLNQEWLSDCSACGGKGYKVTYENVRK